MEAKKYENFAGFMKALIRAKEKIRDERLKLAAKEGDEAHIASLYGIYKALDAATVVVYEGVPQPFPIPVIKAFFEKVERPYSHIAAEAFDAALSNIADVLDHIENAGEVPVHGVVVVAEDPHLGPVFWVAHSSEDVAKSLERGTLLKLYAVAEW